MGNAKIRKDIWNKQKSQIKIHLNGFNNDLEDEVIYSMEEEILRSASAKKIIKKPKKKEWL
jgi:hypothetical protein